MGCYYNRLVFSLFSSHLSTYFLFIMLIFNWLLLFKRVDFFFSFCFE